MGGPNGRGIEGVSQGSSGTSQPEGSRKLRSTGRVFLEKPSASKGVGGGDTGQEGAPGRRQPPWVVGVVTTVLEWRQPCHSVRLSNLHKVMQIVRGDCCSHWVGLVKKAVLFFLNATHSFSVFYPKDSKA